MNDSEALKELKRLYPDPTPNMIVTFLGWSIHGGKQCWTFTQDKWVKGEVQSPDSSKE